MSGEDVTRLVERLKERCRLALSSEAEPTFESVLKESRERGVLRGGVYTLFKKWRLYMQYVADAVPRALSLPDDVAAQFRQFVDSLFPLLDNAENQSREKLVKMCRAVEEGSVKVEKGNGAAFYVCSGETCIHTYMSKSVIYTLHLRGASGELYFPNILQGEELEALQIGWRASDEGVLNSRPRLNTTQPWQILAWAATRPGRLWVRIDFIALTARGLSTVFHLIAKDWEERWTKQEAQRLALAMAKRGVYRPLLTWWLGDGVVDRRRCLQISIKDVSGLESELGTFTSGRIIICGAEARRIARAMAEAGTYAPLLDVLHSHKWAYLKWLTSSSVRRFNPTYILISGVKMRLHLAAKTLYAETRLASEEKAKKTAEKLAPYAKMYKDRSRYVVYIPGGALIQMARGDPELKKRIAEYLKTAEKPIAKKLLQKLLQHL